MKLKPRQVDILMALVTTAITDTRGDVEPDEGYEAELSELLDVLEIEDCLLNREHIKNQ